MLMLCREGLLSNYILSLLSHCLFVLFPDCKPNLKQMNISCTKKKLFHNFTQLQFLKKCSGMERQIIVTAYFPESHSSQHWAVVGHSLAQNDNPQSWRFDGNPSNDKHCKGTLVFSPHGSCIRQKLRIISFQ